MVPADTVLNSSICAQPPKNPPMSNLFLLLVVDRWHPSVTCLSNTLLKTGRFYCSSEHDSDGRKTKTKCDTHGELIECFEDSSSSVNNSENGLAFKFRPNTHMYSSSVPSKGFCNPRHNTEKMHRFTSTVCAMTDTTKQQRQNRVFFHFFVTRTCRINS